MPEKEMPKHLFRMNINSLFSMGFALSKRGFIIKFVRF
jgi:hypothetical protein